MQAKIGNRLMASIEPREKMYAIRDADLKGFILRVYPKGVKTFVCDYRLAGRRTHVVIGRAGVYTPAQARDEARLILADVAKGADPSKRKRQLNQLTLASFVDHEFAPWAEANQKSGKSSIKRLRSSFAAFLPMRLNEFHPWLFEKWRSKRLKDDQVSPRTVNRELATLRSMFSRAMEWNLIDRHPMAGFKFSKTDSQSHKMRFLSTDEEIRLRLELDTRQERMRAERTSANSWRAERAYELYPDLASTHFTDHLKPMVLLSMNTGIRRGEAFGLRWTDVDLQKTALTIRGTTAKSGKTRHIPLNREALETLQSWHLQASESDLVFPSRNGAPLTELKTAWRKVLDRAAIHNFRWHDLRHHFASSLVMKGVDLNTVRELLGHGDIKTTLVYAHLSPEIKADAVARLVASDKSKIYGRA